MSYTDHSVKQEIVMLSRYKGLRSSRFLTVLLSLCSINTLYPAGILFTLTGLMLPLMITFAAPEQKKKEPLTTVVLSDETITVLTLNPFHRRTLEQFLPFVIFDRMAMAA